MKLRDRAHRWIHSRHMLPATAVVSFLESTVLPVPLEVLLVPAMQARRDRLWWLASAATVGCLLGAVAGWLLGFGFMGSVGRPLIESLGHGAGMAEAEAAFRRNGFFYVLGIGLTPVPFQFAMLAAGATGYPLWKFLLATLLSRAARYFGLAALVWWLGDGAEDLLRRHSRKAAAAALLAVAAVFAWKLLG